MACSVAARPDARVKCDRATPQQRLLRLDRHHWRVLDRTQTSEPVRVKLLTGVRSVAFRFLSPSQEWVERWPESSGTTPDEDRLRPAAIEVVLELDDWGEIRRVIEVAG